MRTAIDQQLLVGASAVNAAVAVDTSAAGMLETTHHVRWSAGVTSGAVIIEVSDDPNYTGTWAPVATVIFASTAPNEDYARVAGHYKAMRHRVSTVLAGGTVTTRIVGAA